MEKNFAKVISFQFWPSYAGSLLFSSNLKFQQPDKATVDEVRKGLADVVIRNIVYPG
jgi:hypothetical protein